MARDEISRSWRRQPPERPALLSGELLDVLWDGLSDYFASHPATAGRARELAALVRRNAGEMLGREFYVGRSNYRDRVPRSSEERDDEWVRYDRTPAITDCEIEPGIYVSTRAELCE